MGKKMTKKKMPAEMEKGKEKQQHNANIELGFNILKVCNQ